MNPDTTSTERNMIVLCGARPQNFRGPSIRRRFFLCVFSQSTFCWVLYFYVFIFTFFYLLYLFYVVINFIVLFCLSFLFIFNDFIPLSRLACRVPLAGPPSPGTVATMRAGAQSLSCQTRPGRAGAVLRAGGVVDGVRGRWLYRTAFRPNGRVPLCPRLCLLQNSFLLCCHQFVCFAPRSEIRSFYAFLPICLSKQVFLTFGQGSFGGWADFSLGTEMFLNAGC